MGITFSETPLPYGTIHLAILAGITVVLFLLYFPLRRQNEERLSKVLFWTGLGMLLAEAWKQWFVTRFVYPGILSTWFFPWQLCSMSMYCSFLVPFLKGKARDTVLVFLGTFQVIAALAALLFPGDMMRPQILLFIHSFLYHGTMLLESIAAILILKKRKLVRFFPSAVLFLGMAAVAEAINVISHHVINDFSVEANMFSITPYYPSTQPVFHEIAISLGILPEILIYLAVIILFSYAVFLLEALFRRRSLKFPASRRIPDRKERV